MSKPDTLTINVKLYAGTYIATAKELKVRASCTSGAESAAHVCAHKVYGDGFALHKITEQTFMAEVISIDGKKDPAWRKDLPDDGIHVLVRTDDETLPVLTGYHSEEEWFNNESQPLTDEGFNVTGWMHLEDAARILDAATL